MPPTPTPPILHLSCRDGEFPHRLFPILAPLVGAEQSANASDRKASLFNAFTVANRFLPMNMWIQNVYADPGLTGASYSMVGTSFRPDVVRRAAHVALERLRVLVVDPYKGRAVFVERAPALSVLCRSSDGSCTPNHSRPPPSIRMIPKRSCN